MGTSIDLDAYLRRIGWQGGLHPDLPTLQALVGRHAAAIPFENLGPFLREPVPLDLTSLQDKLVRRGRGGYCFEHNLLFGEVLRAIGFDVHGLAARVLWGRPADAVTARTHMLVSVTVEGEPMLADVGFGGLTLTGVLRQVADIEQATPHGSFRLLQREGEWHMQARVHGEWRSLYRFDLQHQHAIDYELANHWVSTHPSSHFVGHLTCARAAPDRRLALLDNELAIYHLGGKTERRRLRTASELCTVLEEDFLITLPERDRHRLVARLAPLLA